MTKPKVIESICNLYGIFNQDGKTNLDLLITMLHWIRRLRNACAHNERIYGLQRKKSRVTLPFKVYIHNPKNYLRRRDQCLIDGIIYLRYFLNDNQYSHLLSEITVQLLNLKSKINTNAFGVVRVKQQLQNM